MIVFQRHKINQSYHRLMDKVEYLREFSRRLCCTITDELRRGLDDREQLLWPLLFAWPGQFQPE